MSSDSFSDAALVILGHGTTLNAESGAPVFQHAEALRARRLFARVSEAFWKQEPHLLSVLSALTQPRVFIVPFFLSDGYFAGQVIPRALGFASAPSAGSPVRALVREGRSLFYCRPVGIDGRLTDVLLSRAREVAEQFPFPRQPQPAETTLFIAGHGTTRDPHSRQAVERQVELLRAMQLYAGVEPLFLEEEPRIPDCYELAKTRHVIIVPFFLSDGLHVREDIPVLLGEPDSRVKARLQAGQPTWRNPTERNGKLIWCAPSVGTAPLMAGLILDRAREAIPPSS